MTKSKNKNRLRNMCSPILFHRRRFFYASVAGIRGPAWLVGSRHGWFDHNYSRFFYAPDDKLESAPHGASSIQHRGSGNERPGTVLDSDGCWQISIVAGSSPARGVFRLGTPSRNNENVPAPIVRAFRDWLRPDGHHTTGQAMGLYHTRRLYRIILFFFLAKFFFFAFSFTLGTCISL